MKYGFHGMLLFIGLLLTAALYSSLPGCAGGSDVGNPQSRTFASDNALLSYFVDQYSNSVLPESLYTGMKDDASAEPPANEADYSRTSAQEAGVEEADTVKTDGRFLFVAGDSRVNIVDTEFEGGMRQVSRLDIDGSVDSLHLSAGKLIILYTPANGNGGRWAGEGDGDTPAVDIGMPYWIPINARFGVHISDVRDPENPETVKDIQADGSLVSSRLIDRRLHLVSRFFPDIPALDVWYDGSETDRTDIRAANKQKLAGLTLDDFIPSCQVYDGAGALTESRPLVGTPDFLRPDIPAGGTPVSITTIDLTDVSGAFSSVGFIADVHHLYASSDRIYLVSTVCSDDFEESSGTPAPKLQPEIQPDIQTRIYQFRLSGPTAAYEAVGSVPGRILNQFSLGEYNDVLRIATDTGSAWDGSAENHVFCLEKQAANLEIIGRLQGLAPGERLYAARFIGDKGFLVTFVEIDPLFTLDLSDPWNPVVAGKLKVPGVSTRLHPLDETFLLTIGKDVRVEEDFVWHQGLQLSLFDVSDFANPRLIDTQIIGDRGTESEARYNHKALGFMPTKNLVALPVTLHEHLSPSPALWEYGEGTFDGIYVYRITDDTRFEYQGRIALTSDLDDMYGYSHWMRVVFIGQRVYGITRDMVRTADIESLETIEESLALTP